MNQRLSLWMDFREILRYCKFLTKKIREEAPHLVETGQQSQTLYVNTYVKFILLTPVRIVLYIFSGTFPWQQSEDLYF